MSSSRAAPLVVAGAAVAAAFTAFVGLLAWAAAGAAVVGVVLFLGGGAMLAGGYWLAARVRDAAAREASDARDASDTELAARVAPLQRELDEGRERLAQLQAEVERAAREQLAGDPDALVAEERFRGPLRAIAGAANAMTRCHVTVIRDMLDLLDAWARGDFAPELRPQAGRPARAQEIVDRVRANLRGVTQEVRALTSAAVEGRLDVRADHQRFPGEWQALVRGVNETLDAVLMPLLMSAESFERISRGDIPDKLTEGMKGEYETVHQNVNRCIDAVKELVVDVDALATAAIAGRLGVRADPARHAGEFRKIVEGINRTLDAVLAPIDESTRVLERLARRDLTARVNGVYRGEHARIQEAINSSAQALHAAMGQVATVVDQVSSAAVQIASSSQSV
ncbi:MAG TPA: hypothetical protein VLT61_00450, partial [Anaeromyxobacteraceae bacterium]|nr:hypothetical protein [Anaeromyxobacteraceae bacterium]